MVHSPPRKFPRYAADAELIIRHDDAEVRGRTRNISRGGLCAELARPFDIGSSFDVELSLVFDRDTFSEPLQMKARVAWCTEVGSAFQIGMAFIEMTGDQQNDLDLFVRYLADGELTQ